LRHVERTRLLLHLVTVHSEPGRTVRGDYEAIRRELERYSPDLAARTEIVAMTKADLPYVRDAYPEAKRELEALGVELHLISAATHEGVDELLVLLWKRLSENR
jgi:GTP-binding protein